MKSSAPEIAFKVPRARAVTSSNQQSRRSPHPISYCCSPITMSSYSMRHRRLSLKFPKCTQSQIQTRAEIYIKLSYPKCMLLVGSLHVRCMCRDTSVVRGEGGLGVGRAEELVEVLQGLL